MSAKGQFFPRRTSQYVSSMNYAADVRKGGVGKVNLGSPVVAANSGIATGIDVTAIVVGLAVTPLAAWVTAGGFGEDNMGRFGRNITVECSGASTAVFTVNGTDYLGQKMSESFTLNGTTAVVGKKAFYAIDSVSVPVAIAGETCEIGTGVLLGLPYNIQDIYTELLDDVEDAGGTLVVGGTTQTATTADPRGTLSPNTAPDGTAVHSLVGLFREGDLHGPAHYNILT